MTIPALSSGRPSLQGSGRSSSSNDVWTEWATGCSGPSCWLVAARNAGRETGENAGSGYNSRRGSDSDTCSGKVPPGQRTASSAYVQGMHEVTAAALLRATCGPCRLQLHSDVCGVDVQSTTSSEARVSCPQDGGHWCDCTSKYCLGGAAPSQCTASGACIQGMHEVAVAAALPAGCPSPQQPPLSGWVRAVPSVIATGVDPQFAAYCGVMGTGYLVTRMLLTRW